MKNKLKEMLLKHKPITEETDDIDDIWGETVVDGAENFEEIPEDGTPQEDKIVVDVPEEVVEDVPEEENNHTIANAIEEFWKPQLDYHNWRIKANTKKLNKNLDELEKAKKKWGNNPVGDATINKLKDEVDKKAAKVDSHTNRYKEVHDDIYKNKVEKTLYKPGRLEQMIKNPKKLKHIPNPSMFAAQAENRAKADNELLSSLVKTTSKQRDEAARHTKQLQQAGTTPERKEEPRAVPKAMPTTRVAPTNTPTTVLKPHQKVASNAAAVKERLSKVRATM